MESEIRDLGLIVYTREELRVSCVSRSRKTRVGVVHSDALLALQTQFFPFEFPRVCFSLSTDKLAATYKRVL